LNSDYCAALIGIESKLSGFPERLTRAFVVRLRELPHASIGFVRDQPKQFSLFVVLLDEGQSAVSNGAGGCLRLYQPHGKLLPIRADVAIDKVLQRIRNIVTIDIAAALDFEGDIF
jgi:hypothetical protein